MLSNRTGGHQEPSKDGFVPRVQKTYNYGLFKFVKGNRAISNSNYAAIKRSMAKEVIMCFIIVNEFMEIIDGQHRFKVLRELKQPIFYVQCRGYGLKQIKQLNTVGSGWNTRDKVMTHVELGNAEYAKILNFWDEYGLGISHCQHILAHSLSLSNEFKNMWVEGTFVCEDWDRAIDDIQRIKAFESKFKGWNKLSFVRALLHIFWGDTVYDWDRLQHVVEKNAPKLLHVSKELEIRQELTKFYNYHKKDSAKVFFWDQTEA